MHLTFSPQSRLKLVCVYGRPRSPVYHLPREVWAGGDRGQAWPLPVPLQVSKLGAIASVPSLWGTDLGTGGPAIIYTWRAWKGRIPSEGPLRECKALRGWEPLSPRLRSHQCFVSLAPKAKRSHLRQLRLRRKRNPSCPKWRRKSPIIAQTVLKSLCLRKRSLEEKKRDQSLQVAKKRPELEVQGFIAAGDARGDREAEVGRGEDQVPEGEALNTGLLREGASSKVGSEEWQRGGQASVASEVPFEAKKPPGTATTAAWGRALERSFPGLSQSGTPRGLGLLPAGA